MLNLMTAFSPSPSLQSSPIPQTRTHLVLTSQHELWRAEREAHLSDSLAGREGVTKEPPHRFVLTDPLLRGLLLLDQPLPEGMPPFASWTRGKGLGAALLTWFVQQALGIYRLPFCEDRLLANNGLISDKHALTVLLRELTPQRVSSIIDEVNRLYEHTQNQLRSKDLTTVQLRRHIDEYESNGGTGFGCMSRRESNQAGQFAMLKLAAQELGHTTVDIDMDTLNSWGDDGGYTHRAIHLNCSIPIADVLCATELIAAGGKMESGEWVVINRSPTGVVTMPISNLDVQEQHLDQDGVKRFFLSKAPEDILSNYQPLCLRTGINAIKGLTA